MNENFAFPNIFPNLSVWKRLLRAHRLSSVLFHPIKTFLIVKVLFLVYKGREIEAQEILQQNSQKRFPLFCVVLILLLSSMGYSNLALPFFLNQVALQPKWYRLRIRLALLYEEEGRMDDAIVELKKAVLLIRNDAEKSDVYYYIASILDGQGKLQKELTMLQKAIELNPCYADAHYAMGYCLCHMRFIEEGEVAFRRVLEIDSNHSYAKAYFSRTTRDL